MGLCAPIYLAAATVAITKDFLMAIMLILGTLEILGAYIVEFPIFQHYIQNKMLHKAAISSLLGMCIGMKIFPQYNLVCLFSIR